LVEALQSIPVDSVNAGFTLEAAPFPPKAMQRPRGSPSRHGLVGTEMGGYR
jgi:hypothetical protein